MATLKDLKPSINELTNDEALALILSIRENRRKSPGTQASARRERSKASTRSKRQDAAAKLLGALTPEQLAVLQAALNPEGD